MKNLSTSNYGTGQQSKRLACDRCRTQKLKCVRSELSETCQRCDKARAKCNFGLPLPPGRPLATGALSGENVLRETPGPTITSLQQAELNYSRSSLVYEQNHSSDKNGTISAAGKHRSLDPFSHEIGPSQATNLDSENLFNEIYDHADTAELDPAIFGTCSTASPTTDNSSPWRGMEQHNDGSGELMNFSNNEYSGRRSSTHSQRLDMLLHSATDQRHNNERALDTHKPGLHRNISNMGRLESEAVGSQISLMQRLTELGSVMYKIQSTYCPEEHGGRPVAVSETFPTELAGKVLQSAIEFLQFLRHFFLEEQYPPSRSGSLIHHHDLSMNDIGGTKDMGYHRVSNSYSMFFEKKPWSQSVQPSPRSSDKKSSNRVRAVDKPAILQLIANYIRLLQLYLLLYNAVYEYTHLMELDLRPIQPIWSDLNIGGASLCQFADLQIRFVLQIAARLLEEVEGLLGLSDGCRVSKKATGEGSGILGANVTSRFVEMCMSDATTSTDQDRGVITRLRDLMHCMTSMLDTPTRS
ncbi:hypothetical protein GL218_07135 [Daldinia childiae]|uniref:uncharacterized protein n=1 Tax=Daldinia childiae TaxID=326645 RepID=UPI0014455B59|nr:uncharacterized protein GL218_07135 [Daldinia childiae]KAF3055677.1 hypothetical protein GL218_07135 [Daldinia childiae]